MEKGSEMEHDMREEDTVQPAKAVAIALIEEEGGTEGESSGEKQARISQKQAELKRTLDAYERQCVRGLDLLFESDKQKEATELQERIRSLFEKKETNFSETLTDKDFKLLLRRVAQPYRSENQEAAIAMLTCITKLFPGRIHPYLMLASLEWKHHGPGKTARLLEALLRTFSNPLLCLFSAHFYADNNEVARARELLDRGLMLCRGTSAASHGAFLELEKQLTELKVSLDGKDSKGS